MLEDEARIEALRALPAWPRITLAQLPTPIHRLSNFGKTVGNIDLWVKRDDLTGLAGGGNKTRKLEFLVGDAVRSGADTLVTVGAIQSNHTRQTAAAAARAGLKCALLHCTGWTTSAGPYYRQVGNLLLSSILGAELYEDGADRSIEGVTSLDELADYVRARGDTPYVIPGGASDHRLGSLGYVACAAEIAKQSIALETHFDIVIHTTGSSSTQSGLLAGFAALHYETRVIGVSDDQESVIKRERVWRLANAALSELGFRERVDRDTIEVIIGDTSAYGTADNNTLAAIRLLARTEGLIADPVYEGKAIRGLLELAKRGRLREGSRILLLHLGGTPAVHAYASGFGVIDLKPFPV